MNPYILGGGASAAAACATGTEDTSYKPTVNSYAIISPTKMAGESFKVTTNGMTLYSISVKIMANSSFTDKKLTIRYGTGENLGGTCGAGNTCLKEASSATFSLSVSTSADIEVIFQDTNVLSTASTYYFMVHSDDTADATKVSYIGTGEYADGKKYATSSDASDWNLTGHNDDAEDIYFIIKRCD